MGLVIAFILIIIILIIVGIGKSTAAKASLPVNNPNPELMNIYKITIEDIDRMKTEAEFGLYLYKLLLELGYSGVYKTDGSRSLGADLVFTDRTEIRNVIKAKKYPERQAVGVNAIQEIYTSMKYYRAKKSIVVANAGFTDTCETLAGINFVKLIGRNELSEIISNFQAGRLDQAKDLLESEPRKIYEAWKEIKDPYDEIKKDKAVEGSGSAENIDLTV